LEDGDVNQDMTIKRVLKRSRSYFEGFFNDKYFEINENSEETADEDESENDD